ncbi:MAG: hypothetical protein MUP85_04875 [Candidatus Lokiarchaeota archaeon]|nr:hypothetical protein [Candidatus Lokiarchaeota archaeon]
MSKINKEIQLKKSKLNDDKFAFKSVIRSTVLGGIFFIVSILFNGEILEIFDTTILLWNMIDSIIKVIFILLFFIFMIISMGNYKELTGKPLNFKNIILLSILSLIQAFRNPIVFIFTLAGLLILLAYLYLLQDN